mgnify:CR=1 FL=1
MENMVIQGTELKIKEYRGKRVVTFRDIDAVHQRPEGTAHRNFKANRQRFISGVDFFNISAKDVGTNFVQTYGFNNKAPNGILITESGYLMLVKSFTDDLAWKVQRELVNTYFRKRIGNPRNQDAEKYFQAANMILQCPQDRLETVEFLLSKAGVDFPKRKNAEKNSHPINPIPINPDKTIVPGFGTDTLFAYAGQLRDMGKNRNGWIILPNNDFKNFCADRTIPANAFRKWLYENGFILGHTENKSRSTKYTFVYRFNGVHMRVLKFSDNQCMDAERRLL